MTELNNPANCEQFSLCEILQKYVLQKYVGDESAGLLIAALQRRSESLCGECPLYKAKNESLS
jgi:hypothetical protein